MFSVIVLSSDAAARAKVERHAQSAGARIHCARSSSEAARRARQERTVSLCGRRKRFGSQPGDAVRDAPFARRRRDRRGAERPGPQSAVAIFARRLRLGYLDNQFAGRCRRIVSSPHCFFAALFCAARANLIVGISPKTIEAAAARQKRLSAAPSLTAFRHLARRRPN